jgi:putative CocE/NonD family hydrolase
MCREFFDYYLLDSANGWMSTPLVTYFDMGGTDDWITSSADDIAATTTNELFLDQNNGLISYNGVNSSTFVSDPSDPSPTLGGATLKVGLDQGPYDQNSLDSRADVLVFETEDLTQDVSITGRVRLDLWISADQPDCDIAVRLCDKYPTDESMLITDGIKRMRFRNNDYTQSGEELMTAGEIYNVQVDLPFTRYTWKAGHQIKIYISGNNAIRYNVNLQDGGTMYQPGTGNIANITVHHDGLYPSKIILPGNNSFLGFEEELDNFDIYPNPIVNEINISGNSNFESYRIKDINGKLVQLGGMNSSMIRVEELKPGLYVLQLFDSNGKTHHKKFIKH